MIIEKILNNNAVIVKGEDGVEKILLGCGLAFGKKVGNELDESKIQKEFVLKEEMSSRFQQFIQDIPIDTILLAEKIIANARNKCDKKLDDSIYITLTDHLDGALERAKSNIEVTNPLTSAIKSFYPKEFELGLDAVNLIKEERGIDLSIDEVAFITMHFVTAQLGGNTPEFKSVLSFVMDISNNVRPYLEKDVDETSTSWQRFLTHLVFFVQRIMSGKEQPSKDALLFDSVKNAYADAYKCVENLCDYIQEHYNFTVENDERTYLTIHVNRLQLEFGKK